MGPGRASAQLRVCIVLMRGMQATEACLRVPVSGAADSPAMITHVIASLDRNALILCERAKIRLTSDCDTRDADDDLVGPQQPEEMIDKRVLEFVIPVV